MSGDEAAIVLCGGLSRRMGRDKAGLPFGPETLLERTVRLVREVVTEYVVATREGAPLPGPHPMARDGGQGPLAGLAAGLRAVRAPLAFLTACDAPLLKPALVRRLLDLCRGRDAAVPLIDGFHMATCAVYARAALPVAERLLAAGRLRPLFLIEAVDARIVTPDELRDVDPGLDSFVNCNTPEQYAEALKRYTPPP